MIHDRTRLSGERPPEFEECLSKDERLKRTVEVREGENQSGTALARSNKKMLIQCPEYIG